MKNSFENLVGEFLSGPGGEKIGANKNKLQKLATSEDGKKVKEMLEKNGPIDEAIASGNMDAIKSAISDVMKTESGARLIKQLGEIIK